MSEIVQSDILQPGRGPHGPPGMVEAAAAEAPVPVVARKHPGAVLLSRQRFEQPHRRRRELNGTGAGLGVAEVNLPASRSTSDQRRVRTSLLRQPVSISRRIAAAAGGETEPLSTVSSSTRPSRANSASVRKRSRDRSGYFSTDRQGLQPSGTRPHPSPSRYMCDRILTALFAETGRSDSVRCSSTTWPRSTALSGALPRVTTDQWDRIEEAARERNLSPNQLVIELAIKALDRRDWPRTENEIKVARASLFAAQALTRDLIAAGREHEVQEIRESIPTIVLDIREHRE